MLRLLDIPVLSAVHVYYVLLFEAKLDLRIWAILNTELLRVEKVWKGDMDFPQL